MEGKHYNNNDMNLIIHHCKIIVPSPPPIIKGKHRGKDDGSALAKREILGGLESMKKKRS